MALGLGTHFSIIGSREVQRHLFMASDLLLQGLQLMLVGMGTVFVFLTILVVATILMSRLIVQFQGTQDASVVSGSEIDPAVIAAITAAVTQHRK